MATDLREESFLARPEQTRAGSLPLLARWLMVALAYYFAGQLGLLFATVAGNVSPLWPASGVALAVLLLYGTDLWPAIALGASVLSLTTHGVGIGALTCVPNTLEPLLAALLLERAGFDNRLARLRDVWLLLILGAGAGPAVAASIGAAVFLPQGAAGSQTYGSLWSMWWVGDALGVVAVAPALLSLASGPRRLAGAGRVLELGALLAITIVGSGIVFGRPFDGHPWNYPFVLLPLAVWAASRFGQTAVSVLVLIITVTAVWGTTHGLGPFSLHGPTSDLRVVAWFAGILAVMVQVFAAVVTERRKVFQALLASEARRARTERFSLVMVTEVGLDGRWLKVPPTLCRLLGYAEEELLGLRFQDVTHPDDQDSTWRQCLRVIRGELKSFDRESRYVRKDGGIVWGYLNCSVVTDEAGVPLHFVAYIRDISKAKQAEDALRQSEIRFRGVFESGIVPMVFWNTRGEVIEANETYLRLIGRTRSELEAGTLHCHDLTPAEQAHLDQRGVEEVFGSGSCVPFEKEYLRSDGTRVPVLLSASRMSEDTGLAIVIDLTERRRAELEVEERLRFERLVSELVAAFATAPEDRAEALVPRWLGHLGRFLEADRVTLQVFATQQMRLRPSYSWAAGGADPRPLILQDTEFPYAWARLQRGESVLIELLDALPAEAATDREHFERQGIAAVLAIPLALSGQLFGALILAYGAPRSWPDDAIPRLRWVGEMFANVVARKTAEGEMRQAEVLNAAVLASLPGATAILDRHGSVVKVSGGWLHGPPEPSAPFRRLELGTDYVELCRQLCDTGDNATEMHQGVASVLNGSRDQFSAAYPKFGDGEPQWVEVWVLRLARREGGAVIRALDVTASKRAELEATRNRNDLAHMVRVATMGELTASIAHELNQPLTAILANVYAARRMLAAGASDLGDLGDILADIGRDDRRAADIVQRMRALLKKGELELRPLDLNDLVRDVLRLVNGDLMLRRASTVLELDTALPAVHGDRVHLQQVVLNLILNALDAMEDGNGKEPRLTIRTMGNGVDVGIAVSDEGAGIPSDRLDRIFDAFYTTKPNGLGMGLSIARTILDAHGGRLWAANNAGGGATVAFSLPREGNA